MSLFFKRLWFGLCNLPDMPKMECAFQCKHLEATQCEDCKECRGTGVIKMAAYSNYVISRIEKIGYKLIWKRWNPMFNERDKK